jgi:hypothetical protein
MREAGTYDVQSCIVQDGDRVHKGSHVVTGDGMGEVISILRRPTEGAWVGVYVYGGNPRGDNYRPDKVRQARLGEFLWHKRSVGKARWWQFIGMEVVLLAMLIGGIVTIDEGGWWGVGAFVAVNAWFFGWTVWNFNRNR